MKSTIRLRRLAIGMISCLTSGWLLAVPVNAAGSAIFSLSPATGSYGVGSTFTVVIHEDSQTADVNAVQANLAYNPAQLQFVKISSANSGFDVSAQSTGGSGRVAIARAKLQNSLTGDQAVASVTFKTLATSGTAAITFGAGSAIVQTSDNQNIWNGQTAAGSYVLTSGPATQSSSTGDSGQQLIAVKVLTTANQPVGNATVTLDGSPAVTTDSSGLASFPHATSGQHTVTVTSGGRTTSQRVTVKTGAPTLQQFDVRLTAAHNSRTGLWYAGVLLVIVVAVIAGALFRRRQEKRGAREH